MKKILIVEDETPAASRLQKMVLKLNPDNEILGVIDSVEDAVTWFNQNPTPDLAFFDIQLADGLSFSIFEKTTVSCPVIFTTAYDNYAIKAFKVNSIDYLLKPVGIEELHHAWDKYLSIHQTNSTDFASLLSSFQQIQQKEQYKERFLIKKGDQFKYLKVNEVAYFLSDGGFTFLIDQSGNRFIIDDKLDALENQLSPKQFFRINRKFIIGESSVSKISNYFNNRLILELNPTSKFETIVARERVSLFKNWLNR